MKRIILTSAIVLAVAIVATINVGLSLKKNNSSLLTLYQSDVLASGEGSNNSGTGNMYYYEHKLGEPKECTLFKYVNINGSAEYSEKELTLDGNWTRFTVSGMKETCPKNGNGCTVYSCHVTNNTNP
jgi:hypothetical protein